MLRTYRFHNNIFILDNFKHYFGLFYHSLLEGQESGITTSQKQSCKSAVYKSIFIISFLKNVSYLFKIYIPNFSSFGLVLMTQWKFEAALFHAFLLTSQKLWTPFWTRARVQTVQIFVLPVSDALRVGLSGNMVRSQVQAQKVIYEIP